jgi:3D (Asp-Asp-Asp) domain-containing protein
MRTLISRVLLLVSGLSIAGCSSTRPLPKYQQPLARAPIQHVRTTAYTHSESDHARYSNHNALGSTLQSGAMQSAAADWSRWPAGTVFRIQETGELYKVDDYGWALAGTNTIDLYKPSRAAMNAWGVKRVTIENLEWGDPRQSLAVLRPRARHRHVRRMIDDLESRMAELTKPMPTIAIAPAPVIAPTPQPIPVARAVAVAATPSPVVPKAVPVAQTTRSSPVARDPFFANVAR